MIGDILALVGLLLLFLMYFAPYLYAKYRGHQHTVPILALNLFLGWTLIGYVAAVIWAEMRQYWKDPHTRN